MAKIKLEKYVGSVVKALNEKTNEDVVLRHIDMVYDSKDYNSLTCRVVHDVCKYCWKWWQNVSEEDKDANDDCYYSLYKKAFVIAFPTAWLRLEYLENK